MELTYVKTDKGKTAIEFKDEFKDVCRLEESHIQDDCIWVGVVDRKMYLTTEQLKQLIPILQQFIDTGKLKKS